MNADAEKPLEAVVEFVVKIDRSAVRNHPTIAEGDVVAAFNVVHDAALMGQFNNAGVRFCDVIAFEV